jgi:PAS domain S-box-containing protein
MIKMSDTSDQNNQDYDLFKSIVEHFPDIIHSVDAQGHVVSTNLQSSVLLGYAREEMLGKSVFDLYDQSVQSKATDGLEQLKNDGVKVIESKMCHKGGDVIDVEVRSLSLYDEDGEFVKTFSIIRDIRNVKAMQSQLIQSSKLAAVGELAAGIMHDIRNPLSIIKNYNKMILKAMESGDQEKIVKAVDRIDMASERVERLVNHMRSFSRGDVEGSTKVNLNKSISDSILLAEHRVKSHDVKIINKLEIENMSLDVEGRANQIEQIFLNIISNGCDALEGRPKREIVISGRSEGENVCVSIGDSGPGIPENIREKIFESFFTTKEKGKGTGLGLSISYGIIKEHGGELKVETSELGGANFIITLPLKQTDSD